MRYHGESLRSLSLAEVIWTMPNVLESVLIITRLQSAHYLAKQTRVRVVLYYLTLKFTLLCDRELDLRREAKTKANFTL